MLILIGSRALRHHGRLKGREPADWDVVSLDTKGQVRVNGERVEVISATDPVDVTNGFIYWYSRYASFDDVVDTPIGKALVAPLEILKLLKLASAPHLAKAKHEWDLQQLADVELDAVLWKVVGERDIEIVNRVSRQKNEFFNRYKVRRYIDHDELHTFIQNPPTYTKVLHDAVNVDEDRFYRLPLGEQVNLLREEALILALERELIPFCVANPSLAQVAYAKFVRVVDSGDPAIRWMSRLTVPGRLQDHPEWIARWGMANIDHILAGYAEWWEDKLAGLPKSFWIRILTHKDTYEREKERVASA